MASCAPQPCSSTADFVHGVYYPSWKVYRGQVPSCMNLAVATHVFYAFARVRADGSIYHLDLKADTQLPVDGTHGCLTAFEALRRQQYPDLKILLSIGGASGSQPFPALASALQSRETFGRSAREFVDLFHLDGIDVNWEHPSTPEQGRDYVLLLSTLRAYFPSPRYLLVSALPAGEWCLRNISLPSAAASLDFINLMCYDFAGSWTELSGHQSQLYAAEKAHNPFGKRSCHSSVSYLVALGVPSHKIVLGIPVYGRSFLGVDGVGQRFTGHAGQKGIFDYKDLPQSNAQEYVDEDVVAAFCIGGDGGFISYDNPTTVKKKAEYVRNNALGGLFYWTGVTDGEGERSLMDSGYNALNGRNA